MSVKIKICGLKREEDIICASNHGADFTGFIFYKKSPRYVEPNSLRIPKTKKIVKKIGVFVNENIEKVRDIYNNLNLDFVQIHGDETPDYCNNLNVPYWKAFRADSNFDVDIISKYSCSTIVIDAYSKKGYGGTGKRVDMAVLKRIMENCNNKKVIIAGGVSIENVEEILSLKPYGIDINSSVEISAGVKDCDRIKEIINRIKEREI